MESVVFFDTEITTESQLIKDIGVIRSDGTVFHSASVSKFEDFITGANFICGHNVIHHDLKYLQAKQRLLKTYSESNCLENMQNLLTDFELVYPAKYRSDLEEFIKESSYDDFYTDETAVLLPDIYLSK